MAAHKSPPALEFSRQEHAENIIWNAELDEAQAGIKLARRNINYPRYTDDTTLMEESEELKKLLMNVKESVKKLS